MELDLTRQAIALAEIIFINLVLSADNVIVIGLAASALAKADRQKAIFLGIAFATLFRIAFALVANWLLGIVGLALAGGVLLLWVCWKFWREIEHQRRERKIAQAEADGMIRSDEAQMILEGEGPVPGASPSSKLQSALMQIIVADISMSLDNVLGVAGAAHGHVYLLVTGLVLSVFFMGAAAQIFSRLLERFPIIAYIGLFVILYVAGELIVTGSGQVWGLLAAKV